MGKLSTTVYFPFLQVTGNENTSPSSTPYLLPFAGMHMLTHSSLPNSQSKMWSMAELPADAALDAPLNSMISAPLFWMVDVNGPVTHASSLMVLSRSLPLTLPAFIYGYMVGLWLPKMPMLLMLLTSVFNLSLSCDSALLWSSLLIAVIAVLSNLLNLLDAIRQLVLHGLPTTTAFRLGCATASSACPRSTNILPLSLIKSERSIPFALGLDPIKSAYLTPSNALA